MAERRAAGVAYVQHMESERALCAEVVADIQRRTGHEGRGNGPIFYQIHPDLQIQLTHVEGGLWLGSAFLGNRSVYHHPLQNKAHLAFSGSVSGLRAYIQDMHSASEEWALAALHRSANA